MVHKKPVRLAGCAAWKTRHIWMAALDQPDADPRAKQHRLPAPPTPKALFRASSTLEIPKQHYRVDFKTGRCGVSLIYHEYI
ncbi:hypothetical protein QC764_0088570 [Podospora pseudoanserina]|uniref:Uncharacterized protein n=1 Tax=Podospora pseudoanserina TaxID=2609844 RepID=A0ABR0HRS7_9PEZI|nr:hypothetical protein QC764_0088570 [Podospora pseudoanserina]